MSLPRTFSVPAALLSLVTPAAGVALVVATLSVPAVGAPPTSASALAANVEPGAQRVMAGGRGSCEVRGDNTAYCWGGNEYGQLGDGSTTQRNEPTLVRGTGWAQVATGGNASCGIRTTGQMLCWGMNNYNQLGIGSPFETRRPTAVSSETVWSEVVMSWSHGCARRTDQTLWCWGQNLRGTVGVGTESRSVSTPQQVAPGTTWQDVAVGGFGSCGVRTDGSAWCWGENQLGQLGLGDLRNRNAPRRIGKANDWTQVSKSFSHSCGVHTDGRLECWGLNDRGQLGDGTTTDRLSPVAVVGDNHWTSVATSESSTCAIAESGAAWCWGDNRYGQVASGAPDQVSRPTKRPESSPVVALTAGWFHFCTSDAVGAASCWGNNERGQLGHAPIAGTKRAGARPVSERTASPRQRRLHDRLHATSARRIVAQELAPRPAVGKRAHSKAKLSLRLMTFNLLAEQFTAPGAHQSYWAPARLRSEWADSLIRERRASLVGFQEMQPLQVSSFQNRSQGRWGLYPANTLGFGGATQSVAWDNAVWKPTYADTYRVPYMTGTRPQPIVRLRDKKTGRQVYLLNIHYSPGNQEKDRDKATRITIRVIQELQKDKLPIMLTGDFNDRQEVYCKVTIRTKLRAALTNDRGRPCQAPKVMRVDQMFGSKGRFSDHRIDQDAKVRRTTDHSIQVATFNLR